MKLTVDLGGGLELLFGNEKQLEINLVDNTIKTLDEFILYLSKEKLIDQKRIDLFLHEKTIKPGILGMIYCIYVFLICFKYK